MKVEKVAMLRLRETLALTGIFANSCLRLVSGPELIVDVVRPEDEVLWYDDKPLLVATPDVLDKYHNNVLKVEDGGLVLF